MENEKFVCLNLSDFDSAYMYVQMYCESGYISQVQIQKFSSLGGSRKNLVRWRGREGEFQMPLFANYLS